MVIPAIATFYMFDSKVVSIRSTSGKSMDPTIKENSLLLVDHFFYKLTSNPIKPGDIVVAAQPVDPKTHICKRVVQIGGQYLPSHPELMVPQGSYWLEGDNKAASYDSRHHGTVPGHLIEGKVLLVLPI